MKNITRWMLIGAMSVSALLAATSEVNFIDDGKPDGAKLIRVIMSGTMENGQTWSAVPFHEAVEENPGYVDQLRAMYPNTSEIDFEGILKSLKERSSVRFGKGHPHGVLLVKNQEGNCIGHVVIGQHFGFNGIGVPYFFFPDQAWVDGYPQAVANTYFKEWADQVVERKYECFTGPKADNEWSTDGTLRYLMMLSPPDHVREVEMMDSEGFVHLKRWEKKNIEDLLDNITVESSQNIAEELKNYWLQRKLGKDTFYNIYINNVWRSVTYQTGIGGNPAPQFRYGLWRAINSQIEVSKK